MIPRISLSNELIELIPLEKRDFDLLYLVASDKEIWAQHPDFNRYTPVGFTQYFKKLLNTDLPYLIIDKKTEHVIGATSFYEYNDKERSVAIGYTFLAKAYWGGTYNHSVKQLMIHTAFELVDKIIFHVREKNFRSQAALAKIGAIKEKEYTASFDADALQFEYAIYKNA
ncbi:GNAT family N-acetyltransferase [Sphingobacterium pedocola]|uniref:N-acetyltransferase n=1 Tax=Sphingobacterium pedocola TaxID=2082722 RepID=A0ABR9TBC8_9SPHI|nr:GNAT family N-acetyltransferase [Sphingobacterium pedocola]MBE8722374.1 N-acetyltransferase [Sphingobacterium pedocola]